MAALHLTGAYAVRAFDKENLYHFEWPFLFGFFSSSFISDSVYMVFGRCLKVAALAVGSVLFTVGITIVSLGLIEFRSFHRAAGLDSSKLITTRIIDIVEILNILVYSSGS